MPAARSVATAHWTSSGPAGGAAFGAVCGARAPPTLRAIDWGLPAPWAAGAAGREVAEAHPS